VTIKGQHSIYFGLSSAERDNDSRHNVLTGLPINCGALLPPDNDVNFLFAALQPYVNWCRSARLQQIGCRLEIFNRSSFDSQNLIASLDAAVLCRRLCTYADDKDWASSTARSGHANRIGIIFVLPCTGAAKQPDDHCQRKYPHCPSDVFSSESFSPLI
jgi:hypothetical protein